MVIARLRAIPPRLQEALDAVPAAVLTTIVAPALVNHGIAEVLTLVITAIIALRFSLLISFIVGASTIVALRAIGF